MKLDTLNQTPLYNDIQKEFLKKSHELVNGGGIPKTKNAPNISKNIGKIHYNKVELEKNMKKQRNLKFHDENEDQHDEEIHPQSKATEDKSSSKNTSSSGKNSSGVAPINSAHPQNKKEKKKILNVLDSRRAQLLKEQERMLNSDIYRTTIDDFKFQSQSSMSSLRDRE